MLQTWGQLLFRGLAIVKNGFEGDTYIRNRFECEKQRKPAVLYKSVIESGIYLSRIGDHTFHVFTSPYNIMRDRAQFWLPLCTGTNTDEELEGAIQLLIDRTIEQYGNFDTSGITTNVIGFETEFASQRQIERVLAKMGFSGRTLVMEDDQIRVWDLHLERHPKK